MAFPRKSENQKRLQHTFRHDRQPKRNADSVLLSPPDWLAGSARNVFGEVAPLLADHGLTTGLDVHALSRYATAEARRREAESAGHHQAAIRYSKLAEMLGGKLGLNPTDRQRLPVRKDIPDPNGVKRLLDGTGKFFTS
jgi:phage terminase small subunit